MGKLLGKGKKIVILGGFAKCYEGTNIETQKKYAVKVVEKATLNKNRAKQKVVSESNIASIINQNS